MYEIFNFINYFIHEIYYDGGFSIFHNGRELLLTLVRIYTMV